MVSRTRKPRARPKTVPEVPYWYWYAYGIGIGITAILFVSALAGKIRGHNIQAAVVLDSTLWFAIIGSMMSTEYWNMRRAFYWERYQHMAIYERLYDEWQKARSADPSLPDRDYPHLHDFHDAAFSVAGRCSWPGCYKVPQEIE